MPNPIVGLIGSSVGSAAIQSSAAKKAASAQVEAADRASDVQMEMFNRTRELLQPYVEAGTSSLAQQMALVGAAGPEAQQAAISAIEAGPEFQALTRQGEEAILQQASATGGLRGGNTQAALAQFRPQVLSSLINQQYSRLGGLTTMGQNSAAGVGAAGQQTGVNVGNLMTQQGASMAEASLAGAQAFGNSFGNIGQMFGSLAGMKSDGSGLSIPEGQSIFGSWGF
jgi:hypothetical protein